MDRKVYTEIQPVRPGDSTDIESNCNSITFQNIGTGTVTVNGFPIAAGLGLEIEGNENEINVTKFKVVFSVTTPATEVLYVFRNKLT